MPDQWFRFYNDALNDAKVQRLGADIFRAWVNLLCLASKSDGEIKSVADAAFALRLNEQRAAAIVAELDLAGLLDRVEGGYYAPHNWNGRQFKSDSSKSGSPVTGRGKTALLKRPRKRPRNGR
jgi:hypothetical protein